jgi:hypothetical protein
MNACGFITISMHEREAGHDHRGGCGTSAAGFQAVKHPQPDAIDQNI